MLSTVLLRSLAQYGSIRWRQVVQIYDLPRLFSAVREPASRMRRGDTGYYSGRQRCAEARVDSVNSGLTGTRA